MRVFLFNKLVRDKIPERMVRQGEEPEVRILDDDEFDTELHKKSEEELLELHGSNSNKVSELADMLQVVVDIALLNGCTFEDVENERQRKNAESGSFAGRQYIGRLAIPDNSKWIPYFEANPDRYPEIKA